MISAQQSFKVHYLVEHMKSRGFLLEADEVAELGPERVMAEHFDLEATLTPGEAEMLQAEMLKLARMNEMREAQQKMQELFPVDEGIMHFRQASQEHGQRSTTYSLPFSYPVDATSETSAPGVLPSRQ